MDPLVGIIIDSILAILLIAVIWVCNIVYRRLQVIRDGQDELKTLMDSLNRSVAKAEKSVADVKAGSIEVEHRMGEQIARARKLADELTLINEAGNNLADRLARDAAGGKSRRAAPGGSDEETRVGDRQKDILAALKEAR